MRAGRRAFAALVAVFAAAAAVGTTAVTAKPQKKADAFKVAWIYPGPFNDGGWSWRTTPAACTSRRSWATR